MGTWLEGVITYYNIIDIKSLYKCSSEIFCKFTLIEKSDWKSVKIV